MVDPDYPVSITLTMCGGFPDMRLMSASWHAAETVDGTLYSGAGRIDPLVVRLAFEFPSPGVTTFGGDAATPTVMLSLSGDHIVVTGTDLATGAVFEDEVWLPHLREAEFGVPLLLDAFGE